MAGRLAKLLKSVGARDGVVLCTGGLALDEGLLKTLNESIQEQKMAVVAYNHPDSPYAGAIGAALWGAFRHEKLARLGQQQVAEAA